MSDKKTKSLGTPQTPGDDLEPPESSDGDLEEFAEALAVSLRPREIDARRHEAILARALGGSEADAEEEAEAQPDERRRADILRELLDPSRRTGTSSADASLEHRLAGLAHALRMAYAPHEIDQLTSERLLRPALKLASQRTSRRYVAATGVVLAIAAAVLLFFVRPNTPNGGSQQAYLPKLPMIGARSTMDLFDPAEPFPRSGGTTSRIDKIEASRSAELRDNLFASWGVE
jgi:hypothetical protein